MFYEVKCAFILFQPHPVSNTSTTATIKKMLRNKQGEIVFKSTQSDLSNVVEILNSAQVKAAHRYGEREAKFHWM